MKSKGFQVDYNSAEEDDFVITKKNGTMRKFTSSPNVLYYIDTLDKFKQGRKVRFADKIKAHDQNHEHGTVLEVETVLDNKSKFSKQDVHKAELARALQHIAGHLSKNSYWK